MSGAARVPRLEIQTAVCLGTGPSLTADDVEACRGRAFVIAVNDAYRLAPWADVLYACDAKWWEHHQGAQEFQGMKFGLQKGPERFDVQVLGRGSASGLSLDPSELCTGQNSGYQAINLAVLLGAVRIVLLGYDLQARNAKHTHFFGNHPSALQKASPYASFLQYFRTLPAPLKAAGVSVINATRETALTCFERMPLAEALAA